MHLIQIVTGLPPRIDGIGDYALQLAIQLRARHNLVTSFLVADPLWVGGPGHVEGFAATQLATRTPKGLFDAIKAAKEKAHIDDLKLLLHFNPYGYQKRGCPLWLAEALEQWEKRHPRTLNVMFHELERMGAPPWSSGFWVPPFQKSIATRVARLGIFEYTNTEQYRQKLQTWSSRSVVVLPVCSNVREPLENPLFLQRRRDIVVFGRAHQRLLAYERGSEVLAALCSSLNFERIIDIGAPITGDARDHIGGTPIHRCGLLEAEEVSDWMGKSMASFSYYPLGRLGKSGAYAASCAHGTVPFIFDDSNEPNPSPSLLPGQDYIPLSCSNFDPPVASLEALSQKIFDRYQSRASWVTADTVAQAIQ